MKTLFKFTLLILFPFFASAQNLSDAKTYQRAIELAQQKQKPLLLIINVKPSGELAAKILPNKTIREEEVVNKMKSNFIVFETEMTDVSIRKAIATYKINRFPAFLFTHASGDAFYIDFGYSQAKTKYLMMLDKAIALSKEKSISALTQAYETNKADTTLLKQLISLRKKNGMLDNSELIEDYVNQLKLADLNNYQTVLFILEAGPKLDGNAYKFSRGSAMYNEIFKLETLDKRIAINNAIIDNSFNAAVKAKKLDKAYQVASFVAGTWTNDYKRGEKASASKILAYYNAVKDTASYFKHAINFYDRYYMQLSADSIKKLDKKSRDETLAKMNRQLPANPSLNHVSKEKMDSLLQANKVVRQTGFVAVTSSSASQYSTDLNNAAYNFYQIGTKNINHLSKAMIWSKRAVELNPIWPNYDTLAHIYYAMGIYNEALATQKIAVDLAKKENNSADVLPRLTKAYEQIKNRTL